MYRFNFCLSSFLCTFVFCLYVCVLYAFVPHLVNQHIDNLFSLWAASIDKHIALLAARHCAFFLSLHLFVSLCTVDNKLIDRLIDFYPCILRLWCWISVGLFKATSVRAVTFSSLCCMMSCLVLHNNQQTSSWSITLMSICMLFCFA